MNREDIIRMAREASNTPIDHHATPDLFGINQIERFAALVASAAKAKEREACAKVCESGVDCLHPTVEGHVMKNFGASDHLAEEIRARGQA